MNDKCIIIVGHATHKRHIDALKNCIESIRKNSDTYPILLCFSGDAAELSTVAPSVDHYIFTSLNTLVSCGALEVFFKSSNWKISYNVPENNKGYGFAQVQKTVLALQGALSAGYKNFLVMNYDTLILEKGFIDYIFSEERSVFFKFLGYDVRMQADMFKLDIEDANTFIKLGDFETYNSIAKNHPGNMLEDILGDMLHSYNIDYRKFDAISSSMFQLHPFKVLVNNSFNFVMAAVHNNIVHLLVNNQGYPRYTLDGKIEIGYNNKFTTFDVSNNTNVLHPLTEYQGEDIEIVIRTSFGETSAIISKDVLDNSRIEF